MSWFENIQEKEEEGEEEEEEEEEQLDAGAEKYATDLADDGEAAHSEH